MAITDYASLTDAITRWSHRSDLVTTGAVDLLIQSAQEALENDLFDLNWGNGIAYQEASYGPFPITNGVTPVPSDWLAPKVFAVSDGEGDVFTLIFKAAAWIYDTYPTRAATDIPAYIARDVWQQSFAVPQTFVVTAGTTVFNLANTPTNASVVLVALDGATLYQGTDYTLSGTTLTLLFNAQVGQTLAVNYLATSSGTQQWTATSGQVSFALANPSAAIVLASLDGTVLNAGTDYSVAGGFITLTQGAVDSQVLTVYYAIGSVFIFGPYPDSAYQVQGTYYARAPALSVASAVTTNWMTQYAPNVLLSACMVEVGKFLENTAMTSQWDSVYQQRLKSLVDRDKAERWSGSTLQVEVG